MVSGWLRLLLVVGALALQTKPSNQNSWILMINCLIPDEQNPAKNKERLKSHRTAATKTVVPKKKISGIDDESRQHHPIWLVVAQ